MGKVSVQVDCEEKTLALGKGLADFVGAIKLALADGWQTGSDLPAVITAAIADLVPVVQGFGSIGDEFKDDKQAFLNSLALPLNELVAKLLK